jgi:hypothetical protein
MRRRGFIAFVGGALSLFLYASAAAQEEYYGVGPNVTTIRAY